MCGDNSIKAPEMRVKVKAMQDIIPETGKTTFETQFSVSSRNVCALWFEWLHFKPCDWPLSFPSRPWLLLAPQMMTLIAPLLSCLTTWARTGARNTCQVYTVFPPVLTLYHIWWCLFYLCGFLSAANDYRVVLSTDGDQSDYICASYVDVSPYGYDRLLVCWGQYKILM